MDETYSMPAEEPPEAAAPRPEPDMWRGVELERLDRRVVVYWLISGMKTRES